MIKSREFTDNEVRDNLLRLIESYCDEWATVEHNRSERAASEIKFRAKGTAFSILASLDGASIDLPRMIVAPKNENTTSQINCNIAGNLSDQFNGKAEKLKFAPLAPTASSSLRQLFFQEIDQVIEQAIKRATECYVSADEIDTYALTNNVAMGILEILDGKRNLPEFILAPLPHQDDKEFRISNNENYYPENPDIGEDLGGSLHDDFHHLER